MKTLSVVLLAAMLWVSPVNDAEADLATRNAAVEIVIPTLAPFVFQDISPGGGDATLVLRLTTLVTNSWFDATAPYHPTAVGVYTRLGRRPEVESSDNTNMNIALLHASYQVLLRFLPQRAPVWRQMLVDAGLDPDDNSTDITSPVGIGNVAGAAVFEGRANDGMNQLGNELNRGYNPLPFDDYTGYEPVNSASDLRNPSRWQPDIQRQGIGLYKVQKFVTPQYAFVEPYSYKNPKRFRVPPPINSFHRRAAAYKRQADEVIVASADLTDVQKLKAELFDDKIASLGFSAVFAALSQQLSLIEFVHLDFLTNMAAFDAGIFVWQEKARHDGVRPFSAIRYLYGDTPLTAWGGPGQGTVHDIPASEWKSYLEEADHPEYPSASTCFCAAHTQSARLYLGHDTLGYPVEKPAGSSRIEPGVVPANDTVIVFPTWTEFNEDCGQSRVWAGVHFQAAIDESRKICDVFGDMAYDYLQALVNGTAPARGPSEGRFKKRKKRR